MKLRLPHLVGRESYPLALRSVLRRYRWWAIALTTSILVSLPLGLSQPVANLEYPARFDSWFGAAPAAAQLPAVNIADTSRVLYERLPFIPLENQYVDQDGNELPESTLLSRLMLYHGAVQQRQPYFRLDWKLTMADYLGANETMHADTYPNSRMLQENPMDGDVEAIRQLTREQREELVDTIVLLLNPLASRVSSPEATPSPVVTPSPATSPSRPAGSVAPSTREPQPGDAQLLLP